MKPDEAILQITSSIIEYRKRWGWSKAELSRKTGVSTYLITKLERGENVGFHHICKLLPFLGLKIDISSEVTWIEGNLDDYYDKHIRPNIELDKPGGVFDGMDSSQFIVDWKNSAKSIK